MMMDDDDNRSLVNVTKGWLFSVYPEANIQPYNVVWKEADVFKINGDDDDDDDETDARWCMTLFIYFFLWLWLKNVPNFYRASSRTVLGVMMNIYVRTMDS